MVGKQLNQLECPLTCMPRPHTNRETLLWERGTVQTWDTQENRAVRRLPDRGPPWQQSISLPSTPWKAWSGSDVPLTHLHNLTYGWEQQAAAAQVFLHRWVSDPKSVEGPWVLLFTQLHNLAEQGCWAGIGAHSAQPLSPGPYLMAQSKAAVLWRPLHCLSNRVLSKGESRMLGNLPQSLGS